jgi:predicted nucleic acid-binding protein
MSRKPTVYLDTNVISALYYEGGESAAVARRLATWQWWEQERPFFMVHTSGFAEGELAEGAYRGQKAALALVRRITYLPGGAAVRECSDSYLAAGVVPATKPGDAAHLAFASVHRVDYLLSWNHSHLSNDQTQAKLDEVNKRLGWRSPLLRSPFTIPKVALGQDVRRRA